VDPGQLLAHAPTPELAKRLCGGELDEEGRRQHEAIDDLVLRHYEQDLGKSLKSGVLIGRVVIPDDVENPSRDLGWHVGSLGGQRIRPDLIWERPIAPVIGVVYLPDQVMQPFCA
jgi:hypothetical protein